MNYLKQLENAYKCACNCKINDNFVYSFTGDYKMDQVLSRELSVEDPLSEHTIYDLVKLSIPELKLKLKLRNFDWSSYYKKMENTRLYPSPMSILIEPDQTVNKWWLIYLYLNAMTESCYNDESEIEWFRAIHYSTLNPVTSTSPPIATYPFTGDQEIDKSLTEWSYINLEEADTYCITRELFKVSPKTLRGYLQEFDVVPDSNTDCETARLVYQALDIENRGLNRKFSVHDLMSPVEIWINTDKQTSSSTLTSCKKHMPDTSIVYLDYGKTKMGNLQEHIKTQCSIYPGSRIMLLDNGDELIKPPHDGAKVVFSNGDSLSGTVVSVMYLQRFFNETEIHTEELLLKFLSNNNISVSTMDTTPYIRSK